MPAAAAALRVTILGLHHPLTRALTVRPTQAQLPLPAAAVFMRPEPDELALFLLCLVVPPLVAWGLSLVAQRLPRPRQWALTAAAILVQACTVAAALRLWWFQNRRVYAYFFVDRCLLGVAATATGLGAAWAFRRWRRGGGARFAVPAWASAALAATAAGGYAALRLRATVFDDASILVAPTTVNYHLPFTLGEFAAVLNGRTPGVDFFPQYVWFLPYPLALVFRATGLTVHTFTLAMAALSFVAFALQYDVLRRVTGRPWVAVALFVPLVALAFHPVEITEGRVAMAFDYFAVGPLRYFGPLVVGWLVAWYLSSPAVWRAWLVFAAAGLSALNNLDFGLPALGGVFLALGLTALGAPGPRARRLLVLAGAAALGLGAALATFQVVAYLHHGRLVDLSGMTVFQRAFAVLGFGMLPLPPSGIHWDVYLTFMLGLGVAVVRLAALRAAGAATAAPAIRREQVLCGALTYGSVFGAGALTYFIGRSHWAVLPAIFAAWGAVLVVLVWLSVRGGLLALRREPLRVVPAILATIAFGIAAGEALPIPYPQKDLYQPPTPTGIVTVRHVVDAPSIATALRGRTAAGEKVMIATPAGHLTAELAGVDDVFPFVEAGSCLVVGQLDEVVARMRANGVTKYFGPPFPALQARVAAAGLSVQFLPLLDGPSPVR